MDFVFYYGVELGAGLTTGIVLIDIAYTGLKKLIGRYIHIG